MPRSGGGTYSLPAGLPVNGETSDATDDLRTPLFDLEADANTPRPVVAGGTGASDAATARTNLGVSLAGLGAQPLDADLTSWAAITRAAGFDAFVATPSSANLRTLLSDEVGTGAAYFVGGALGTPASGTLTNCTGLPFAGLAAAAVVTEAEGIASNDNDTTLPTSAAVKDYVDSNSAGITLGTPVTASGTQVDFTGIPSTARRVTVLLSGVSHNSGTAQQFLLQLGDSGGIEATGYTGSLHDPIVTAASTSFSTSFALTRAASNADIVHGRIVLECVDTATNLWVATGQFASNIASVSSNLSGSKTLSAALDRIRLLVSAGSFDAGTVNVSWE